MIKKILTSLGISIFSISSLGMISSCQVINLPKFNLSIINLNDSPLWSKTTTYLINQINTSSSSFPDNVFWTKGIMQLIIGSSFCQIENITDTTIINKVNQEIQLTSFMLNQQSPSSDHNLTFGEDYNISFQSSKSEYIIGILNYDFKITYNINNFNFSLPQEVIYAPTYNNFTSELIQQCYQTNKLKLNKISNQITNNDLAINQILDQNNHIVNQKNYQNLKSGSQITVKFMASKNSKYLSGISNSYKIKIK